MGVIHIRLIHGECLEEMDKLIAEGVKVDAIVTDPHIKLQQEEEEKAQQQVVF